jgi:hypothetical protein
VRFPNLKKAILRQIWASFPTGFSPPLSDSMPLLVALDTVSLATTGATTGMTSVGSAKDSASVSAYPASVLRPTRSEGTLVFLAIVAVAGMLLLLGWLMLRRRASTRPGLPDEPLFPPAIPHQQIHDRKYLSRILSSEDPPRN